MKSSPSTSAIKFCFFAAKWLAHSVSCNLVAVLENDALCTSGTRETATCAAVVYSFSRSIYSKSTLISLAFVHCSKLIFFTISEGIKLTTINAMQIIPKLIPVRTILRVDDSQTPWFMCSQRIAGMPKLNQLANRALYYMISFVRLNGEEDCSKPLD